MWVDDIVYYALSKASKIEGFAGCACQNSTPYFGPNLQFEENHYGWWATLKVTQKGVHNMIQENPVVMQHLLSGEPDSV